MSKENSKQYETPEREYAILPVKGVILYPGMPSPLAIGKERSISLITHAMQENANIVVVGVKPEAADKTEPDEDDLYTVGTVARTYKMLKIHENYYQVIVQGIERVHLTTITQHEPYFKARIKPLVDDRTLDQEIEALGINLRKLFDRYLELENTGFPVDLFTGSESHPADLAYLVAGHTNLDVHIQQELLEIDDLNLRLRRLVELLTQKMDTLELSHEIQQKMKQGIEKSQREVYLREQLKTIQHELGMDDGRSSETDDLRKRIEEAHLPEEALETANRELDRLSKMPPSAAEYTVSRTYLDWITELPWSKTTEDNLGIDHCTADP